MNWSEQNRTKTTNYNFYACLSSVFFTSFSSLWKQVNEGMKNPFMPWVYVVKRWPNALLKYLKLYLKKKEWSRIPPVRTRFNFHVVDVISISLKLIALIYTRIHIPEFQLRPSNKYLNNIFFFSFILDVLDNYSTIR